MSVQSIHRNACQDIFQSNSHAAYIKSEEEQDAIRSEFLLLGIPDYIYYRIGIDLRDLSTLHSSTLFWEDRTPVTFRSFSEDSLIGHFSESGGYCVFLNLLNNLKWETIQCNISETQTATLCQLGKLKLQKFDIELVRIIVQLKFPTNEGPLHANSKSCII